MNIFQNPEWFDIFGLITFPFILAISVWALRSKSPLPEWVISLLFFIGLIGVIVDGVIVYTFFLK